MPRHKKERKPSATLTVQIPTVEQMPVGLQRVADAMADPETTEGFWVGGWFHMHEPKSNSHFHPDKDAHEYAVKKCQRLGYDCASLEGKKLYDGVTTRTEYRAYMDAFIEEWFETNEEALKAKGYSIH